MQHGDTPSTVCHCSIIHSKLNNPPHRLWACISKKDAVVKSAHCDCMEAGMSGTCLHVAAMFYRVEAAVRFGLTNPSCTAKSCEWLPNRKDVVPCKVKDFQLNRDDFGKRGKKSRKLISTPKKLYNPVSDKNIKHIKLTDIAVALEKVQPFDRVLSTAVAKPKIDFLCEIVTKCPEKPDVESIDDVILKSDNVKMFYMNLPEVFTAKKLEIIEYCTRGQSNNELWFIHRKGVISGSKGHDVKSKMEKLNKGVMHVNLWQTFQKISGLVFVNPNIPALKYGQSMEVNAINEFYEHMSKSHKNLKLSDCGIVLDKSHPYIGASPDQIVKCDCCSKACLEVKCPYSINYTSPNNPDNKLEYLKKDHNGVLKLNKAHKYYTQCQMQMGVTGCSRRYFFVWTQHGFVMDTILFDPEWWLFHIFSYYAFTLFSCRNFQNI